MTKCYDHETLLHIKICKTKLNLCGNEQTSLNLFFLNGVQGKDGGYSIHSNRAKEEKARP